jgi:hypothetical protein
VFVAWLDVETIVPNFVVCGSQYLEMIGDVKWMCGVLKQGRSGYKKLHVLNERMVVRHFAAEVLSFDNRCVDVCFLEIV